MLMVGSAKYQSVPLLDQLFKLFVLACLYTPFIESVIPIKGVNLLDDLLFFALVPFCIIHATYGFCKGRAVAITLIIPAYLLLSVIISLSYGGDLQTIILSIKNMKNIFLFFILICLSENHIDFVKKNILFILYASIPVAIYQFFTVEHQDDITGLFGPKSTSLYSFLVVTYIAVTAIVHGFNKIGWRWILFIPILLNETKIAFLLFPLLLIFLLFYTRKIKLHHILVFFIVGFISLIILNKLYINLYGYEFSEVFTYEFLDSYLFDYTDLHKDVPRFYRIYIAYSFLSDSDLFNYLFGFGLGSEYVGHGGEKLGHVAKYFEYTILNQGTRIQLVQLLYDFGVVGVCLFLSTLIVFFVKILTYKSNENNLISLCLLILMIFSVIYQNMFFTKQISFIFFFFVYQSLGNKFKY